MTRTDAQFLTRKHCLPLCHHLAVCHPLVGVVVFIECCELVAVDKMDFILHPFEVDRLIEILHFVIMRMRRAVGSNQSIQHEVSVVRLVTEVTSVCPKLVGLQLKRRRWTERTAIDRLGDALVHPVPNGSTHDAGVGIYHIPILLQIAHRIAHSMTVLTHDKWAVADSLCLLFQFVGWQIAIVIDS